MEDRWCGCRPSGGGKRTVLWVVVAEYWWRLLCGSGAPRGGGGVRMHGRTVSVFVCVYVSQVANFYRIACHECVNAS